ncbi:MAG: hypothetical protein KDI83_18330, partial [Gammaproteobacteria bacterium]|nr:hypothetical protein [Gammaproteobacteria bacterium]
DGGQRPFNGGQIIELGKGCRHAGLPRRRRKNLNKPFSFVGAGKSIGNSSPFSSALCADFCSNMPCFTTSRLQFCGGGGVDPDHTHHPGGAEVTVTAYPALSRKIEGFRQAPSKLLRRFDDMTKRGR